MRRWNWGYKSAHDKRQCGFPDRSCWFALLFQILIFETAGATGNPFASSTTSPFVFLDQLSSKRWDSANGVQLCLAHAFTNQDFNNGVIGLANVGTICSTSSTFGSVSNGITVFSDNTGITTTVNFGNKNPELQVRCGETMTLERRVKERERERERVCVCVYVYVCE